MGAGRNYDVAIAVCASRLCESAWLKQRRVWPYGRPVKSDALGLLNPIEYYL
jgi:hypothetical protein